MNPLTQKLYAAKYQAVRLSDREQLRARAGLGDVAAHKRNSKKASQLADALEKKIARIEERAVKVRTGWYMYHPDDEARIEAEKQRKG